MFEPGQYDLNEVWVVFRLNSAPMVTETEGDFDVLCIMDAASCFILATDLVPDRAEELPQAMAQGLIERGRAQVQALPRKLLLASGLGLAAFEALAPELGLKAQWASEEELAPLVTNTRASFAATIERGRAG